MNDSGMPCAAVTVKGGASTCGGVMEAAVGVTVTGWIVVACRLTMPFQSLGPHSLLQTRQWWNLAWFWHPS